MTEKTLIVDLDSFERMLPLIRKSIIEGSSHEADNDAMIQYHSDLQKEALKIMDRNDGSAVNIFIRVNSEEGDDERVIVISFGVKYEEDGDDDQE